MSSKRKAAALPLAKLSRAAITMLASSGIDIAVARKCQIVERTAEEMIELTGYQYPSVAFPYFNLDGSLSGFERYRLMPTSEGEQPPDDVRYLQPKKTGARLYFPPLIDWQRVADDVRVPLIITEGEKKAISAFVYKLGPCIGLGGVFSFKSKGSILLPEFDKFNLKGRKVIVAYDSDTTFRPELKRPIDYLSTELLRRGAEPYVITLPEISGTEKVGLDDFLVSQGADAWEALEKNLHEVATTFKQIDSEYAWVDNLSDSVIRLPTGALTTASKFKNDVANLEYTVIGSGDQPKRLNAGEQWIQWPHRHTVNKLVYEPTPYEVQKILIDSSNITSNGDYNTWPGWPCEPKKGDVGEFLRLLDHIFLDDPSQREWFEQWIAYPIQNPGIKLYTASIFTGLQGSGKSFLGQLIGLIYGLNFKQLSSTELRGGFNSWIKGLQFCVVNEFLWTSKRQDADFLKDVITRETVRVNEKYQAEYTIRDRTNYFFTSNHEDALLIEDNDRRYFVHHVTRKLDLKHAARLNVLQYDLKFVAALFYWALNLSLRGFNPRAPAPETIAKLAMREQTRSEVDRWAHGLAENPDAVLNISLNGAAPGRTTVVKPKELYTGEDLARCFDPDGTKRGSSVSLGHALGRAGLVRLSPARIPRTYQKIMGSHYLNTTPWLWVIREKAKWAALSKNPNMRAEQYVKQLQADGTLHAVERDSSSNGSGAAKTRKF